MRPCRLLRAKPGRGAQSSRLCGKQSPGNEVKMKLAVTLLVFCVAALLALGMTMLYSSTMGQPGAHYLLKQLLWCPFALALCVGAASLDYRLLRKLALPLLIISVVLLGLVL